MLLPTNESPKKNHDLFKKIFTNHDNSYQFSIWTCYSRYKFPIIHFLCRWLPTRECYYEFLQQMYIGRVQIAVFWTQESVTQRAKTRSWVLTQSCTARSRILSLSLEFKIRPFICHINWLHAIAIVDINSSEHLETWMFPLTMDHN